MDTDMARGLLMPSPRLRLSPAMVMAVDTAMAATVVAMDVTDTARGLLSLAMATGATAMAAMATAEATATGVSYHRIRRSELSQKQNHKNSHCWSCENMKNKYTCTGC